MAGHPRGPAVERRCTHATHHPHGTNRRYVSDKCRCTPCRAAAAAYSRHRNRTRLYGQPFGVIPAIGSRRRLEALQAIGWTIQRLAGLADHNLSIDPGPSLTVTKAAAIAAVYDRCSMTPAIAVNADERRGRSQALRRARLGKFAPPLCWDDDTIDDPSAQPNYSGDADEAIDIFDPVLADRIAEGSHHIPRGVTSAERVEAIRRLAARRYNDTEIAERIGSTPDAVTATRTRNDIPAGVPCTRPDQRRNGEAA